MLPTFALSEYLNALLQSNQKNVKLESIISWTYFCLRMYHRYQHFNARSVVNIVLLIFYQSLASDIYHSQIVRIV